MIGIRSEAMVVRGCWIWAVGAMLALSGCRGCGCDDAHDRAPVDGAAIVDTAPDATLAETMGPQAVEKAITEGLRAIAAGDRPTAIARFEAARAADPGRRVPQQRLCGLYRDAGRTADALHACEAWRELETEPDFRDRADAIIRQLSGR